MSKNEKDEIYSQDGINYGFTMINNKALRDTRLGINARGVLVTLLSFPADWNFSVSGLTKILPNGKDAIRKALNELEKYGYIKRTQERNVNGKFISKCQITDIPGTFLEETNKLYMSNSFVVKSQNLAKNTVAGFPSTVLPTREIRQNIINNINKQINDIDRDIDISATAHKLIDKFVKLGLLNEGIDDLNAYGVIFDENIAKIGDFDRIDYTKSYVDLVIRIEYVLKEMRKRNIAHRLAYFKTALYENNIKENLQELIPEDNYTNFN